MPTLLSQTSDNGTAPARGWAGACHRNPGGRMSSPGTAARGAAASSSPVDDATSGSGGPRRAMAVAAVLGAMALVVLDASAANVALPTIARSHQVTSGAAVWVVTAYQMALVMTLLPCAALGESVGHRGVFVSGVVLFSGASLLCALSPSLPWLLAGRFLQGIGGAAVMALGMALLRFTVSPERFGAAIGWNTLTVALSSAAGPAIGAAVLSIANWPWLFGLKLPLAVLVLVASRALPAVRGTGRQLDAVSVTMNAGLCASSVLGAALLPARPAPAVVLIGTGVVALVALIRRETPKDVPLIPIDLLRDPSFRNSVIASVLCFSGVSASLLALPFHLQHALGQSAWMTGLYMTPWPVAVAMCAPLASRLSNRTSTAWLCATGGILLAIGLGATALWPVPGGAWVLIPFTMVSGFGFGLFNVANNRNMFLSVPKARSGAAGGLQGTARLTGQTAGAIIMTLLFASASNARAPRLSLGIAAVLTLAAGLASTLRAARPPASR